MAGRLVVDKLMVALLVAAPTVAAAQEWVPGTELIGQSVVVETNGIANTVYFDAGGAARIVTPLGKVVSANWTAADKNLCLNSGAASECWPYAQAFQAGQKVTLTSSCKSVSEWLPNGTNSAPVEGAAPERG